jgi:hypothetical protein
MELSEKSLRLVNESLLLEGLFSRKDSNKNYTQISDVRKLSAEVIVDIVASSRGVTKNVGTFYTFKESKIKKYEELHQYPMGFFYTTHMSSEEEAKIRAMVKDKFSSSAKGYDKIFNGVKVEKIGRDMLAFVMKLKGVHIDKF